MFKPLDRMYIEALATKQDQSSISRMSVQNNSYADLIPAMPHKNSQMTTQGSLPDQQQHQTANSGRNKVAYFGGNNRSVSSGSKNNNYTLQELEKIVTNSHKKNQMAKNSSQKESRSSSVKRPQA